jgi:hypothetical protein
VGADVVVVVVVVGSAVVVVVVVGSGVVVVGADVVVVVVVPPPVIIRPAPVPLQSLISPAARVGGVAVLFVFDPIGDPVSLLYQFHIDSPKAPQMIIYSPFTKGSYVV